MNPKAKKRNGAHRSSVVHPRTSRDTQSRRQRCEILHQQHLSKLAEQANRPVITLSLTDDYTQPGQSYICRPAS